MWPSVQVQLTLVLTRRGNVGTEVATNKQGIRRCTGRSFKASWSLGKTIRTPRTDGHQGYAQRLGRQELLCHQSPSLRGHQPCLHRGSDLGLHAFRTLRLRQRLWYEVIQHMVFFVTEQLVQVLHWPQFLPLWEGYTSVSLENSELPAQAHPPLMTLPLPLEIQVFLREVPCLYPGRAVARVLHIVFPAGLLYHQGTG